MGAEDLIKYQDLISAQDIEFWDYLCNKDFKRLNKLASQSLGDGIFFDDSDTSDSEEDGSKAQNDESDNDNIFRGKRGRVQNRDRYQNKDEDDEDEDFDHDGFMEQMLADMH